MNTRTLFAATLVVFTCCGLCLAEKNAAVKPMLVKPEKVVVDESFSGEGLPAKFIAVKGDWKVEGGVLVGKEKKEDEHAGVLNLQVPNRDSSIQFSFNLEGAQAFHLSLNHAKGHLFRVIITPEAVVISKDKDKEDENSKAEVLGRAKAEFAPGTWHTMLVEMQGDEVVVQTDGGVTVKGSNPALATDKPNYRFIIRGSSVQLDDVKVSTAAK